MEKKKKSRRSWVQNHLAGLCVDLACSPRTYIFGLYIACKCVNVNNCLTILEDQSRMWPQPP